MDSIKQCVKYLPAKNFSGRTNYLKDWLSNDLSNDGPMKILLGEFPYNYVSGLAPTITDEIFLHDKFPESDFSLEVKHLLVEFGFYERPDRTPFDLSGGEQSFLVIACALLLQPKKLAIDTTLEQLNSKWRDPLLTVIKKAFIVDVEITISDNRINEYGNFLKDSEKSIPSLKDETVHRFTDIYKNEQEVNWRKAGVLEIINLSFGYDRKNSVIKNSNYVFKPGNIYHLKGENGAGKSTLSKLLCGLYKPNSGSITYKGESVSFFSSPGQIIGYNFQNPDDQLFNSTVQRELIQSKKISDVSENEIFTYIVSSFGFESILNEHPANLPFVMRKRLSIASTIINERDWYVFDEPTIGQDEANIEALANLFKYLSEMGKGIILISHSQHFIDKFNALTTILLINSHLS